MNLSAAVVTTFPDNAWDIYAKKMLQSFIPNWPQEIPLLIALDDDLLLDQVKKFIRPQDAIAIGWGKEHKEFVERNKDKDDPQDYRKMPVRFCHKVFAIARAYDASLKQRKDGQAAPRYLIWMDADVLVNRPVTVNDIQECIPQEGDAIATLQRKDWPHSECGWMAFDIEGRGGELIVEMFKAYCNDRIIAQQQQDDSWMWDLICKEKNYGITNLTANARGLDVWQFAPMGKWSRHYKGPMAKQELLGMKQHSQQQSQKVVIQTQNAIPHEEICAHIAENQKLIKNWVKPCKKHNEEIVIASAGPMMIAEDLRKEQAAGKKIVAVKHALEPLKKAGIKPWACILLDPRPHMNDFVQTPDTGILWFVASQVEPSVTMRLLAAGCNVWGYHAAVGAGENEIINKESYAIISGGSATATRGLFLLSHLGFSHFTLYGYDLSLPDKPKMEEMDERGQPKHMEISVAFNDRHMERKKHFWTEPQFIAQFDEMNEIVKGEKFKIKAHGDGIVPFLVKSKEASDLRNREHAAKIMGGKTPTYQELLGWTSKTNWLRPLPKILRRRMKANKF